MAWESVLLVSPPFYLDCIIGKVFFINGQGIMAVPSIAVHRGGPPTHPEKNVWAIPVHTYGPMSLSFALEEIKTQLITI